MKNIGITSLAQCIIDCQIVAFFLTDSACICNNSTPVKLLSLLFILHPIVILFFASAITEYLSCECRFKLSRAVFAYFHNWYYTVFMNQILYDSSSYQGKKKNLISILVSFFPDNCISSALLQKS